MQTFLTLVYRAITSADGAVTMTVSDSGPSGPVTFVTAAKQNV
jgi:chitinase